MWMMEKKRICLIELWRVVGQNKVLVGHRQCAGRELKGVWKEAHRVLGRYRRRKMNAVSGAGAEELKLGTVHAVLAELAMFKASCCMRESHINKGSRRNDPPMVEASHWV